MSVGDDNTARVTDVWFTSFIWLRSDGCDPVADGEQNVRRIVFPNVAEGHVLLLNDLSVQSNFMTNARATHGVFEILEVTL